VRTRILATVIACTIGLALSAAAAKADVACGGFSSSTGQCINGALPIAGTSYNADWYLPNGTPTTLMLLQHGFSRGCGNLRGTSKAIMEKGVMVLCLNANMTGGNPNLGIALGDAIRTGAVAPPGGRPLPPQVIAGGHSAGGHFASVVGARLAASGFAGLRGAVLFDPVASGGFSENVQAIAAGGSRPVLSVAARPSAINLFNNSFGALKALPNQFVGVQLVWSGYFLGIPYGGSCHTDVEGENGDVVGNTAALCSPDGTQVSRLRNLSSNWARDIATGTRTPAYWCTNAAQKSTCGSQITSLVGGFLPKASLIPIS
jgi:hypothetical protein